MLYESDFNMEKYDQMLSEQEIILEMMRKHGGSYEDFLTFLEDKNQKEMLSK